MSIHGDLHTVGMDTLEQADVQSCTNVSCLGSIDCGGGCCLCAWHGSLYPTNYQPNGLRGRMLRATIKITRPHTGARGPPPATTGSASENDAAMLYDRQTAQVLIDNIDLK